MGEWVWLSGHGRERGGDGLEVGFDVGGTGEFDAVAVAGVGAGDPVSVVAFDPCQGVWRSQWAEIPCAATQGWFRLSRFQRWS